MKYLNRITTIIMCCCITANMWGQRDIEIIKIKNEDRSVDVSIVNYSNVDYSLILTIESEGMDLSVPLKKGYVIPADSTVFITRLIAMAEQNRYKISCQATPVEEGTGLQFESPDIIFYSKNSQEESTQLRNYLEKHDIPYLEYNVTFSAKTRKRYEAMLERRGLDKKKVKLPVVIVRGEVHHSVKNMTKFIKKELSSMVK